MITLEPVGVIRSPETAITQGHWGELSAEIHLKSEFEKGLTGIEQFSHITVVFYLHQSKFEPGQHLQRHPRGFTDLPKVGVFAQRTKYRPNPVGITTVKLVKVERNVLTVTGLDAIDQTPVLDIKPYFPVFDRVDEVKSPEWAEDLFIKGYF